MSDEEKRVYRSQTRDRQANETRDRIIEAARQLLATHGYAGMTIEAIATGAEVSAQSVYAIYGSKAGVVAEVIKRAIFGSRYEELVKDAMRTPDPYDRLRYAARIACQIFESEGQIQDLLRGGAAVAPQIAELHAELETRRYDAQQKMIAVLESAGVLKPTLDTATARDILWALTSRELYRLLVQQRSWSSERYERWLGDALVENLLV